MNFGRPANQFTRLALFPKSNKVFSNGLLNSQNRILKIGSYRFYAGFVFGQKYGAPPGAGGRVTTLPFGKHKGTPLNQVPRDYLVWLMEKSKALKGSLKEQIQAQLQNVPSSEVRTTQSTNPSGGAVGVKAVMPFGKHKGIPLNEIPKQYLEWILAKMPQLKPQLKLAIEAELKQKTERESGNVSGDHSPIKQDGGSPVMPYGKHKGAPLSEIPLHYLTWALQESDITQKYPNLLSPLRDEIDRKKKEKIEKSMSNKKVTILAEPGAENADVQTKMKVPRTKKPTPDQAEAAANESDTPSTTKKSSSRKQTPKLAEASDTKPEDNKKLQSLVECMEQQRKQIQDLVEKLETAKPKKRKGLLIRKRSGSKVPS